jgi:hypothetical protein
MGYIQNSIPMSRGARARLWAKEHQDQLVLAGIGVAIVGILVVVVKVDMKYQDRMTRELNAHIDELNALMRTEFNAILPNELAA